MTEVGVIRFVDKNTITNPTAEPPSNPLKGTLMYTLKKDLPSSLRRGVFIYCSDTQEIFHGNGLGYPLSRVSDVLLFSGEDEFPDKGVADRLYIDKSNKGMYYWNGSQYVLSNEGPVSREVSDGFYKILASMKFIGYKQRFTFGDDANFPVALDHVPAKDTIKVYVNGVGYEKPSFLYDRATNLIYWLFNESRGGFDLQEGFEIVVSYDFLYSDNQIADFESFVNEHRKRD